MLPSNFPELNLDLCLPLNSTFFPEFLVRFPASQNYDSNILNLNNFILRLEEELKKIESFKRELPLSFLLVQDAIGKLKEEAEVLKKKKEKEEGKLEKSIGAKLETTISDPEYGIMKSWLSSAQLWSPQGNEENNPTWRPDPIENRVVSTRVDTKDDSAAAATMHQNKRTDATLVKSGSRVTGSFYGKQGSTKPGFNQRGKNQRRHWTRELHKRFVEALEKLGGPQVATPKQIREVMKVEGLTNDEVKSHLQKYRLHIRKLPSSSLGAIIPDPAFSTRLSMERDQHGLDSSKLGLQHSISPAGPLHLPRSMKCNSTSVQDEEEEEEEKSDGQSCKVHNESK